MRRAVQVLHDIDQYVEGINAYYRAPTGNAAAPGTRSDIYAINVLKGQFVGEGGGREADNAHVPGRVYDEPLGAPAAPTRCSPTSARPSRIRRPLRSVPGTVHFQPPRREPAPGNVIIDAGSFQARRPGYRHPGCDGPDHGVPTRCDRASTRRRATRSWSPARRSATTIRDSPRARFARPGHRLARSDVRAVPRLHPHRPRPDYAGTLTSAGADIVDTYAETLCDGSDTKYQYRGECRA